MHYAEVALDLASRAHGEATPVAGIGIPRPGAFHRLAWLAS